jgi:hypothetical protein
VTWWSPRRRRRTPEPPPARPGNGNGNGDVAAAELATTAARYRLKRDADRVDEWTGEVRRLLGGRP